MPGFDGTGPRGEGPMTGGGMGFCAVPLSTNRPVFRRRAAYPAYGPRFSRRPGRAQELDLLKSQTEAMQRYLEELEVRIEELAGQKQ